MKEEDFRQYAFVLLLEEAEAAQQAEIDEHRAKVQRWFDALTPEQKKQLGEWMDHEEWLTCQALSVAAGDWYRTEEAEMRNMLGLIRAARRSARQPKDKE